jgi:glyoxylase-like metal-dependent hydrolase (beta-lactamase superfamily II)
MRVERVDLTVDTRSPDGRVAAYVVGSRPAVLVDPGTHSDALDALVEEAGVEHVCCTHHHSDHTGGVAHYAEGVTVWARAGREDEFTEATGVDPDRTFREGTTVVEDVDVMETPGHAPEHVALSTPAGTLSGDLAVAEGSVVVGAPEGDMRAYLSSLRRLYARDPERLYPGHGPVIENPRKSIERLISHRLSRETSVLAAVSSGARTVPRITDAAYEKDLTGVKDLARATVRAHLEKLAAEGRVEWDGERARPAE